MNQESRNMTPKYVDLFAGIGGFAAAFEAMGFQNEVSAEFDPDAARTYKFFWGHDALADVTKLAPDVEDGSNTGIGRHDVLAAGFPCQPFSKSGAQLGVLDKSRGTLFHNILNAIRTGSPSLVILENVRNLAGPKHEKDLQTIKESLKELGYRVGLDNVFVSPHKISPRHGGRPQNRERIFIVATKVPSGIGEFSKVPLDVYAQIPTKWNPKDWRLSNDLLSKPANSKDMIQISDSERLVLGAWDDFVQLIRNRTSVVPAFPVWVDYWRENALDEEMPAWKIAIVQKNFDFYFKHKEILDSWLSKYSVRTAPEFTASKRKLEWQAQDMSSLFDGLVHFRPSGVRVKQATYLPALVAITQTPVIASESRRLSVREAARLQGFPDSFTFEHQTDAKSFKQLGNGVNIGVVWWVLKSVALRDKDLLVQTDSGRQLLERITSAPDSPDEILAQLTPKGPLDL